MLFLGACGEDATFTKLPSSGAFSPGLLDFGEVSLGASRTFGVVLDNTGTAPLVLESISLPPDFVLRGFKDGLRNTVVQPGGNLELELVFFPSNEGFRIDQLVINARDADPIPLDLKGLGSLRRLPELVLEPEVLHFGRVEVGRETMVEFTIRNVGLGLGTVDNILLQTTEQPATEMDIFHANAMLPFLIEPQDEITVQGVFRPTTGGILVDQMVFNVMEGTPQPTLSVSGEGVVATGDLLCDPSSLDFGPVERGASTSLTMQCEARGGPVSILGAQFNPALPYFRLPTPVQAIDLDEGQSTMITVQFNAEGLPARHDAALEINYNGSSGIAKLEVPMAGEVAPPPPTQTALTVVLEWTENNTDVDLHLIRPGGTMFDLAGNSDCFYANRAPDWGTPNDPTDNPFLDDDDVDGLGPETINLDRMAPGAYEVQVHYFSDRRLGPTNATVQLFVAGEAAGSYTRPSLACNDIWHVGTLNWDGTNGTFQRVDTVRNIGQGNCN